MREMGWFRNRGMKTKGMVFSALLAALPCFAAAPEEDGKIEKELVEGDWLYSVLGFDAIPAVDDPVFVSREEAEPFMDDAEPILGLVLGGEARGYSLWHLEGHEIVNDTVGGRAVAVTW